MKTHQDQERMGLVPAQTGNRQDDRSSPSQQSGLTAHPISSPRAPPTAHTAPSALLQLLRPCPFSKAGCSSSSPGSVPLSGIVFRHLACFALLCIPDSELTCPFATAPSRRLAEADCCVNTTLGGRDEVQGSLNLQSIFVTCDKAEM